MSIITMIPTSILLPLIMIIITIVSSYRITGVEGITRASDVKSVRNPQFSFASPPYGSFGYVVTSSPSSPNLALISTATDGAAGKVFVYKHSPATQQWTMTAQLVPSASPVGSLFGQVAVIGGDYAAVSTYDNNQVHIFERHPSNDSWTEVLPVIAVPPAIVKTDIRPFTLTMADSGDWVMVGGQTNGHNAYVYARQATNTWQLEATLPSSASVYQNLSADAMFAASKDSVAIISGNKVLFFRRTPSPALLPTNGSGGSWQSEGVISLSLPSQNYLMSVSMDGDVTVVGVTAHASIGVSDPHGHVYTFVRNTTTRTWARVPSLDIEGESIDHTSLFGMTVRFRHQVLTVSLTGSHQVPQLHQNYVYVFRLDTTNNTSLSSSVVLPPTLWRWVDGARVRVKSDDANAKGLGSDMTIWTNKSVLIGNAMHGRVYELSLEGCPAGDGIAIGHHECSSCLLGNYSFHSSFMAQCELCLAGYYCPTVASQPIPCTLPGGMNYCPAGSTTDRLCPAGYYCPSITGPLILCNRTGDYCPPGTGPQEQLCPPGHYCPTTTHSIPTPAGYYCGAGCTTPKQCTVAGTYCPPQSVNNNTLCGIGFYCPTPAQQVACTLGDYCATSGETSPGMCPDGFYCPTTTSKQPCTAKCPPTKPYVLAKCTSTHDLQCSATKPSTSSSHHTPGWAIALIVIVGLLFVGGAVWYVWWRRQRRPYSSASGQYFEPLYSVDI